MDSRDGYIVGQDPDRYIDIKRVEILKTLAVIVGVILLILAMQRIGVQTGVLTRPLLQSTSPCAATVCLATAPTRDADLRPRPRSFM